MHIALVTSATPEFCRGNYSTVQRWVTCSKEHRVICIPPDPAILLDPIPDIIHGYHALHGGVAACEIAKRYCRPLVISLGGSDLWILMNDLDRASEVRNVLMSADCVTGAFDSFGDYCRELAGSDILYVTVPRSVIVPDHDPHLPDNKLLSVILSAGLRRVKDPVLAVDIAKKLVDRGVRLHLTIMGSVVEDRYASKLKTAAADLDFVDFGVSSLDKARALYRSFDMCWNTSLQEGGANALLEAMANGCAVMARDVVGNREYFKDKKAPAKLFDPDDIDGIEQYCRSILTESVKDRLDRVGRARAWLRKYHNPENEAIALVRAWEAVTALK